MKMQFNALHVLALCACIGQLCSSKELSDEDRNKIQKRIQDSFYGVGEQFMDDIKDIFEKYRNDPVIVGNLPGALIKNARKTNATHSKIDAVVLKDYFAAVPYFTDASALDIEIKMDNLKVLHSILSRQLQPERYNGIMNLLYIFLYQNATSDEIENTLGYLYGTDTAATKTSYLEKFPDLSSKECSRDYQAYTRREDTMKSMIDIKPKVIQDLTAIGEKFPCTSFAFRCVQYFVYVLERLHGDKSKINACMIKESPGNWDSYWTSWHNSREYMEQELQQLESVLPTRLDDASFRGLLNFQRSTMPDTPINEIEKALEYLYDDVPKTECPTTETTTLKTE